MAMIPTLYPSSHASNLLLLRNGDVLCFWFSGSAEGEGNVAIVVSRLPKGSKTWGPAQLIDRESTKSYQNPVPFEAPDGTVWLLHTQQTASKGQGDAEVLKVVSHDQGRTWSRPEVLFKKEGAYDRQPIVVGDHGEWIVPMYYSTSAGITKGAETNYSVVEVSRDNGKSWEELPVPESEGLVQMSIVKLGIGKYVAFFRSRYADFIYRSTSSDGERWSKPEPTVLPNNNASIQASVLSNGHIVVAFNNTRGPKPGKVPQTGPRVPLSLGISEDRGVTWNYVRDLEVPTTQTGVGEKPGAPVINLPKGQEYSYPSVLQLPDGSILTTYTFRREAIKAVKVSEQWIREGNTVGVYQPKKAK
jgi:predicted neuraminidase